MTKRNNSLDLLRCICMLFVVIIHVLGHSGFLESFSSYSVSYYISNYLVSCVRVAVPVFVLITGYFGINFKTKKLIGMEISLLFYGVFSMILAWLISGNIELSTMNILKTCLPFSYKSWWFATMYMVLLIFSPFINRLLDNIKQKEHLILLIASFILFNVISSFSLDPIETTNGFGFVNFIFLYCIGRYIRKYGLFDNVNKWFWLFGYFAFSFLILLSYRLYGNYKFGTYNSVLLLLSSVSFFMFFEKQSINANAFSKIAPYTFAVYLISDNFFMRSVINKQLFDPCKYQNSVWIVLFIILYAALVMICCMLIDFVFKKLFGKIKVKFIDFIDKKAHLLLNFVCKIILQ